MKQDWRFAMGFFFNSGLFEICFMLVFLVVIAMFVVNAVRGIGQWNKNNHAPELAVAARVVSRRTYVNSHHQRWHWGQRISHIHKLLRHLRGGERGQDGIPPERIRIWDAGGGGYGKAPVPGNQVSRI